MQKYLEQKLPVNIDELNQWYAICQSSQKPYIVVKTRTKFADVEWDYISFNPEVDDILIANAHAIMHNAISIFEKYANDHSDHYLNESIISFKNLEINDARLAAEDLYGMLTEIIKSNHQSKSVH